MAWFEYVSDRDPSRPRTILAPPGTAGTPAAPRLPAPQYLYPLFFCVTCRTANRPYPSRWCRGCGEDLLEQEALLWGGIHALLAAKAPAHMSPQQVYESLRGEELVRLYSEAFYLWESSVHARRGLWPPDFPLPLPGAPAEVSIALARLGLLLENVSREELYWTFYTLDEVFHPDSSGDASDTRIRLLTSAFVTVRYWLERGCPRVIPHEPFTPYDAIPAAPTAPPPVECSIDEPSNEHVSTASPTRTRWYASPALREEPRGAWFGQGRSRQLDTQGDH